MSSVPVSVVWTRRAREDLIDFYVSIGTTNPTAAERLYDRIEEKSRHLADQPRMGRRRPDIAATVRALIEAPYVILYETIPDADDGPLSAVEIVRVVDGRRDLTDLF